MICKVELLEVFGNAVAISLLEGGLQGMNEGLGSTYGLIGFLLLLHIITKKRVGKLNDKLSFLSMGERTFRSGSRTILIMISYEFIEFDSGRAHQIQDSPTGRPASRQDVHHRTIHQ